MGLIAPVSTSKETLVTLATEDAIWCCNGVLWRRVRMCSPPCTLLVHNLCTLWNTLFSILIIFHILSIYNIKCIDTPKFYYSSCDASTFRSCQTSKMSRVHHMISWGYEKTVQRPCTCVTKWHWGVTCHGRIKPIRLDDWQILNDVWHREVVDVNLGNVR